jgi:3-phenylpropionate/trans-cinnamate dioxygenase ferredoxin reductase subunit
MTAHLTARYGTIVVGSGHAGTQVASSLLAGGYDRGIAIITDENVLPYDRPALSKTYLSGEHDFEDIVLREPGFWESPGITLRLGSAVVSVDPDRHEVATADGARLGYGSLVWAAGGSARRLVVPGVELDGVHSVRGWEDARRLKDAATGAKSAVIVGGGYIGLESAAVLTALGVAVTVVEVAERLLARVTGAVVADHLFQRHTAAGVAFRLGVGVEEILGDGVRATGVRLSSGETLEADIVLVGVGLVPNVDALARAGAHVGNGVEVDEMGRTSLPDVFAVGDGCSFPIPLFGGRRVRLESVQNAVDQAKTVSGVLLGSTEPYAPVPWFWSHQYDVKLQTAGLLTGYEDFVVRGDPQTGRFSVVYLADSTIIAVDAVNQAKDFIQGKSVVGRCYTGPRETLADPTRRLKDVVGGLV